MPYLIDLFRLGGEMRTRVSAITPRGHPPILSVSQRGAFAWKKDAALQTGDVIFDRVFVVTTGAAEDAEGLRGATRSLLFLAERREGLWLSSDGLKVTVSWRGMESDPLVVDAARDAVVMVAGWHRPDSPYR